MALIVDFYKRVYKQTSPLGILKACIESIRVFQHSFVDATILCFISFPYSALHTKIESCLTTNESCLYQKNA